jgi:predicted DNA-binding transcriptional regulator YafY
MYQPTTRVLTVLELLQTYGQLSSHELARRLDVTPRSIRRYIMMLQDLGIPVESTRGRHGGYRLRPGYKLPPLMFTNNEAVAITLGLLNVERLGFHADEPAIEGALAKIGRVLPLEAQQHIRFLQESTILDDAPGHAQANANVVLDFSQAVQQQRRIWLRYQSPEQETARTVDVYGLVLRDGTWYAAGWCHLRNDVRVFRLDRVWRYRVLSTTFTKPDQFNARETVQNLLRERHSEPEVELLLHTTISEAHRWVSVVAASLEDAGTHVIMRCNVGSLEWLAMFILSMPWDVTVRKPAGLRHHLDVLSSRAAAISFEEAQIETEGDLSDG